MLKVKKFLFLIITALFLFSLFISTGCSRHPNPEQISAMEEARSACLAAEQKLNELQQQRQSLESKLSSLQNELNGLNKEKSDIQQRLTNWNPE
jgi:peptidoglycan hydrolase CwlO-like protein